MGKEMLFHEPARDISVIETDVFVVGAGTAGCVAAMAAARAGAKVVLIEKMPAPTGTMGNGGNGFYSFFAEEVEPGKIKQIVRGIPFELQQKFEATGAATPMVRTAGDPHRNPYRSALSGTEALKATPCEILTAEPGVDLHLHTAFAGVQMEDGKIKAAFIQDKDGRKAVVAKQYIDCSGDADMARACGLATVANWDHYDEVCGGPIGLVFGMAGIDAEKVFKSCSPEVVRPRCARDGKPTNSFFFTPQYDPEGCKDVLALDLNFFSGFSDIGGGMFRVANSRGVKLDCSTAEGLTRAEVETRIKIQKFAEALKKDVPGFENAYVYYTAFQAGIRSSAIVVCDKMITQEEISAGARFDDEIGLYGFHDLSPTRNHCFINHDGFYGFPYRMLLPKGCDNLYMAGRCVTQDIEAHMSTRNTVGCMLMGQGAGVAAALCAKKDCGSRELPYAELRENLLKQDVILDA